MAVLFRIFLRREIVEQARKQANKGIPGVMQGHAEMNMSVTEGPLLKRMLSDRPHS